MPLISSTIPNLINGVSQQPAPTRIRTAGEVAENCYMSVVSGLQKRQHSRFISKVSNTALSDVATRILKTSTDDKFLFVVDGSGDLSAYDIDSGDAIRVITDTETAATGYDPDDYDPGDTTLYGNIGAKTVGYLASTAPKNNLKFTTVADHTYILNTTKKVGIDDVEEETPADRTDPTGVVSVFIKRAVPNSNYAIYAGDYLIATITTKPNTSADSAVEGTAEIAKKLKANMELAVSQADGTVPADNADGTPGELFTFGSGTVTAADHKTAITNMDITGIEVVGSVLTFTTDSEQLVTVLDQFGGAAMRIIQDEIQEFSDLPPMEAKGRMVKVVGDADAEGDDYWVLFNGKVWVETVAYGKQKSFNTDTMPHRIIYHKNTNGMWFEVTTGDYADRIAGDEKSNSEPTFVNKTINNIFLYKGRMGYLTDENLVMSEVSEYGNFWRTTATQVIDTDRIDVASTTGAVNILRHATAFGNSLVLFSDTQQFKVTQGDVLSPATVGLQPMTTYDGSRNTAPVNSGPNVFFAVDGPRFTIVREMYIDDDGEQFDAAEVTVQVPKYIPTGVNQMVVSTYEDALVIQAGPAKNELYVYKWYLEGKTKIQSAWSKWVFDTDLSIISLAFMDQDLIMVYTLNGYTCIDRIRLEEAVALTGEQTLLLDHQMTHLVGSGGNITSVSYDTASKKSTITLPVKAAEDIQCWSLFTDTTPSGATEKTYEPFGDQLAVEPVMTGSDYTNQIKIAGDWRQRNLAVGYPYTFNYQFSDQFVRTDATGGDVAVQDGRLQLRYMSVVYQDSAHFVAEVMPKNRDARSYVFNARTLADNSNKFGLIPVETGEFRFPITAQNTKVTISLKSDKPFPCSFGLAEWDGLYHPRTQRI